MYPDVKIKDISVEIPRKKGALPGTETVWEKKTYAHFGLEAAIAGNSLGLVYKEEHYRLLSMVEAAAPETISHEFASLFKPSHDEDMDMQSDFETCVWVDIGIDGISLWKNSSLPKAIPILMRIHAFGKSESTDPILMVPIEFAKPAIVGLFHGVNKPNLEDFLDDIVEELVRLHPRSPKYNADGTLKRKFSARVRCIIADAVERAFIFGKFSIF